MISFSTRGSSNNTERYLRRASQINVDGVLHSIGRRGVAALSAATPVESGIAASSWGYKVSKTRTGVSVTWTNSDVENGFPVAVMIQYGHGTGTGGYVQGQDYINPALRPIFDQLNIELGKAVKSA